MNKLKGWRTVLINGGLAIVGILEGTNALDLGIPTEHIPWWAMGIGIVNLFLRTLTTTPIFNKGDGE